MRKAGLYVVVTAALAVSACSGNEDVSSDEVDDAATAAAVDDMNGSMTADPGASIAPDMTAGASGAASSDAAGAREGVGGPSAASGSPTSNNAAGSTTRGAPSTTTNGGASQ